MRYLDKLGMQVKGNALAIEYAAHMDESRTSEIIVGYYKAVDADAISEITDGTMTPAEQQVIDGLLRESEQMMSFVQ